MEAELEAVTAGDTAAAESGNPAGVVASAPVGPVPRKTLLISPPTFLIPPPTSCTAFESVSVPLPRRLGTYHVVPAGPRRFLGSYPAYGSHFLAGADVIDASVICVGVCAIFTYCTVSSGSTCAHRASVLDPNSLTSS